MGRQSRQREFTYLARVRQKIIINYPMSEDARAVI